jgi:membrane protease YdiL (CAAX protease family)
VPVWDEIRASFSAWLIVAVVTALPVLGVWFLAKNRRLFPPQRQRSAPWNGFEVCLVFLFTQLLVPAFRYELLNHIGFFNWLYGAAAADSKLMDARHALWSLAFGFLFQLAGTLIILRLCSGTRLYQLGLTSQDAGRQVVLGWLAWLLLTPPVIAVNIVATWGYWLSEGTSPEEHPLARLARDQPLAIDWGAILLTSMVMAPVLEELLFRRVLQGWAAERPWGGPIILLFAFALTTVKPSSALRDWEPALFVLLMAPWGFVVERLFRRWLRQRYLFRALYSTAILFAVFHLWPTPVPLFVLGLGLGFLAYRTQNLIAPIVCHALFNGVACVVMLLTYAAPANGKEAISPARRPPSASTSRTVPGSWLPRRTYASAIACPRLGDSTQDVTRPTSWSARKSVVPEGTVSCPANFNPLSDRLTWP